MTSVLDLKNHKNQKIDNDDPVSDVLSDERKEEHLNDFLNNLNEVGPVDTPEEIPDNPGIMQGPAAVFPTTFASVSWSAPDKHHELISHAWRRAIIVLLVGMAFLALFWQDSILTAVTFFGLAFVTSMHFWRESRQEQHEIHPHGVVVAGNFYHYHDFDSFWVHFHPRGFHELSLKTGRLLNHYLKIPLGEQDPFEVRAALMEYLPEEKHEEGLDDWLRRKLGL